MNKSIFSFNENCREVYDENLKLYLKINQNKFNSLKAKPNKNVSTKNDKN